MSFKSEYDDLQFDWSLNRLTPQEYQRRYDELWERYPDGGASERGDEEE
jgi:hypothetical protein